MSAPHPPKRTIFCVDGSACGLDGTGPTCSTPTNVYQIYASIHNSSQTGSLAPDGYFQEPVYESGIGSADDTVSMSRILSGGVGDGYLQQIRRIYERCCQLTGSDDEIWLFGFGRGAFVARAVAGLLHYLRAIVSAGTPQFATNYDTALRIYKTMHKQDKLGPGSIYGMLTVDTRRAAKIKFVGVFDTVRAVQNSSLFDVSLNDSIKHLRHALALHEDREAMTPDYIFPDTRAKLHQPERSFVQAWFIGAHIDLGGSSANAGLSLYPLQWMLLEAQSLGLALAFGGAASVDNPLHLVFPAIEEQGKGVDLWRCKTENGLEVQMQDLRRVTEPDRHEGRYSLKLNRHLATFWPKSNRNIFDEGGHLNGWTNFPQGTIIHPSVYLLIDESINISLDTRELRLQNNIEHWRKRTLGTKHGIMNQGFWNERSTREFEDLGAIRVLVCGNTGVGKSTLINKVFGVPCDRPVAEESHRCRGIHNVREEIRYEGRDDLIVHDSGGFEAGASEEMDAIKAFLEEKSKASEIKDRLHVIWFCIELISSRTMQHATEDLFKAVSQYAQDVPIILVATKKDDFWGAKFHEYRQDLKKSGKSADMDECDRYAEGALRNRTLLIKKEMLAVEGGRLDACVPVSKDDDEAMKDLTDITARCFNSEKVRILYIRAQVTRIDLKVNLAVAEVIRTYKRSIRGATAVAGLPSAPTTTYTSAAVDVCRKILNCFGVPSITAEMALGILKSNILDDLGNNFMIALSEGLAAVGVVCSVATLGMPFFLVSHAVNVPLAVPATARLLLMLAADLILILVKSFHEASKKSIGQPLLKDLNAAARAYRPFSKDVHKKIKKLVPRKNPINCFRTDKVKLGFEQIVEECRGVVMGEIDPPRIQRSGESDGEDSDIGTDATLIDDMAKAKKDLEDISAISSGY